MTEIRYVCKDTDKKGVLETTLEVKGMSSDLLTGLARIAVRFKKDFELKDGVTFEDALLESIKVAEREEKLNDIINKKDKSYIKTKDLVDLISLIEDALGLGSKDSKKDD